MHSESTLLYDTSDDDPHPEEAHVWVDPDGGLGLTLHVPGEAGYHCSVLSVAGARRLAGLLLSAAQEAVGDGP